MSFGKNTQPDPLLASLLRPKGDSSGGETVAAFGAPASRWMLTGVRRSLFRQGLLMSSMRYTRSLNSTFNDHLRDGMLKWLVDDTVMRHPNDPFAIDVHTRDRDCLTYYHGTTKLLSIRHDLNDQLIAFADKAYAEAKGYEELMRKWSPADLARAEHDRKLVSGYLESASARATDGYYRNREEGFWQNRLSTAFGRNWKPGMDWLIVDRECVVGFDSDGDRRQVLDPIQEKFQRFRDELQKADPKKWGQPSEKGLGNECDFLAIGPSDELYCIELKHRSYTRGIYWGSLQVAVYAEVFSAALPCITNDLKELVRQKVDLGLLPCEALKRLPRETFRKVVPVLAVADPNDASSCWTRLAEVMTQCRESVVSVVEIRNYDDPAPVPHLWTVNHPVR